MGLYVCIGLGSIGLKFVSRRCPAASIMPNSSGAVVTASSSSSRPADPPQKRAKNATNVQKRSREDGEDGEGPGVSAGPSATNAKRFHRGDDAAQELSERVSLAEESIWKLHLTPSFFHTEKRRDLIMTLPTEAGSQVLEAFLVKATPSTPDELHKTLEMLTKRKWAALNVAMDMNLGQSTTIWDEGDSDNSEFDAALQSTAYEERWKMLQARCAEYQEDNKPCNNPCRAWRSGNVELNNKPGQQMYPEGIFGKQAPKPNNK